MRINFFGEVAPALVESKNSGLVPLLEDVNDEVFAIGHVMDRQVEVSEVNNRIRALLVEVKSFLH